MNSSVVDPEPVDQAEHTSFEEARAQKQGTHVESPMHTLLSTSKKINLLSLTPVEKEKTRKLDLCFKIKNQLFSCEAFVCQLDLISCLNYKTKLFSGRGV